MFLITSQREVAPTQEGERWKNMGHTDMSQVRACVYGVCNLIPLHMLHDLCIWLQVRLEGGEPGDEAMGYVRLSHPPLHPLPPPPLSLLKGHSPIKEVHRGQRTISLMTTPPSTQSLPPSSAREHMSLAQLLVVLLAPRFNNQVCKMCAKSHFSCTLLIKATINCGN